MLPIMTLPASLPPLAKIFAATYDPATGGYTVPPREMTRPFTPDDVARWKVEYADKIQYDSVELEVAMFLYSVVRMTGARTILETGCSRGFSTSFLAAGAADNGGADVTSIDIERLFHLWEGSALEPSINFIAKSSVNIMEPLVPPQKQFDLLFLDSLHTYAHLMQEIMIFEKSLKVGGAILLHDTMFYDCLGPVALELTKNPRYEIVNLPSPRTHGRNTRCPGVTLAIKISNDWEGYPLSFSQEFMHWITVNITHGRYEGRQWTDSSMLDLLRREHLFGKA